MHGDFEHANFVLKEDDYLQYEQNFKLIETYVKSLIAGNVVLFIGYSFNDPDVKHIFSWLRYLLKGDLQRAYIIITGEKSNILYEEYFKNLGLNVIYSDKIIRNINDYKQDEQLEHILTWLQKRENDQYYEDFIVDYINNFTSF